MYDGKSDLFEELDHDEPIDIEDILVQLELLTGIQKGKNFELWLDWFVNQLAYGTNDERLNLKDMYEFKKKTDKYSKGK